MDNQDPAVIAEKIGEATTRLRNAQAEFNHLDKTCAAQEVTAREGRMRQEQLRKEIESLKAIIGSNEAAHTIVTAQQAAKQAQAQAEADRADVASLKAELQKLLEDAKQVQQDNPVA